MIYVLFDLLRSKLIDWDIYFLFMLLDQLAFRALAAAALAFFTVLAAGPAVIRWLRRKKIGDSGLTDAEALRAHTASKSNTPTMGGVLIVGAIFAATLLLADVRNFYVLLGVITMLWLAALGGIDDWLKLTAASRGTGSRQGLYAWEKLVFQLGLGVLVGYFLYTHGDAVGVGRDLAHVLTLPFQRTYDPAAAFAPSPSLVYLPFAAFVLVATLVIAGMSNAVNITDGMDGLAAGVTVAVSVGLVVLTQIAGNQELAQGLLLPHVPLSGELLVLIAATSGACLGFLWFNCFPARVFMGDTGALALGGVLAYVAVVIRHEVLLLIMSGVFLLEIASVVIQVGVFKATRGRKRVFLCAPIHHHFHIRGMPEQQVVVRAWIISAIMVIFALALIKVR